MAGRSNALRIETIHHEISEFPSASAHFFQPDASCPNVATSQPRPAMQPARDKIDPLITNALAARAGTVLRVNLTRSRRTRLAIDQVLVNTWRGIFRVNWRWPNMAMFPGDEREKVDAFTWKQGKVMLTLSRAGDSWQVSYLTQGRLMGPRLKVYEAIHRQAKFAAWDIMAKVISVTHDEDEGVEVAVRAAQWMRRSGAAGA
jgi:hypothetical protein